MPRLLKDLVVTSVDSVDKGAGVGVRVLIQKREDDPMSNDLTLEQIKKGAASGELSRAVVGSLAAVEMKKAREAGEYDLNPASRTFNKKLAGLINLDLEMGRATGFAQSDHYIAKNSDEGASDVGSRPPEKQKAFAAKKLKDIADAIKAKNPRMTDAQAYARASEQNAELRRAVDEPVSR